MKARNFEELAQELRELIGNPTKATEVEVIVENESIIVIPKDKEAIHHTEVIIDFCRCKQFCNYVTYSPCRRQIEWVIF